MLFVSFVVNKFHASACQYGSISNRPDGGSGPADCQIADRDEDYRQAEHGQQEHHEGIHHCRKPVTVNQTSETLNSVLSQRFSGPKSA